MRSFLIGCLALLVACDSAAPISCSAQAGCTCNSGSCWFTASTCVKDNAGVCDLICDDHATCVGTCGDSCGIECTGGSSCSATVGTNGSVVCDNNSICNITCTGSCLLACQSGALCELNCPDNGSFSIPTGVTTYCG